MKKDVLFLCQYFSPEYISSATLPTDVAKQLVKKKFSVDVLTGYPYEYTEKKVEKEEMFEGIKINRVKYLKFKKSSVIGRILNFFSLFISMSIRLFKMRKYKVIIVYSNPPILPMLAVWAKRLFKVKIVFVSFDVYPEIALETNSLKQNGVIYKVMTYINKKLFKNVDKVVALSSDMESFLMKNREISSEKIKVIPNWYDEESLDSEIQPYKPIEDFIKKDDLVISYFGNMGVCQDMSTLIETIAELSDEINIKFLLAGHGVKQQELREAINEKQLKNVRLFDFLRGSDYQYALSVSDAFVVSLVPGVEGLAVPSKTYSYLMAGKALISIMSNKTDIAREVETNKMGIHIENNDIAKFKTEILYLAKNRSILETYGENARKLFLQKYTTEVCTEKYVELIKELI